MGGGPARPTITIASPFSAVHASAHASAHGVLCHPRVHWACVASLTVAVVSSAVPSQNVTLFLLEAMKCSRQRYQAPGNNLIFPVHEKRQDPGPPLVGTHQPQEAAFQHAPSRHPTRVHLENGSGGAGCQGRQWDHVHTFPGAFSHSAGTAPIITVFIPGTPLQTTPPQKRA